MNEFIDIDQKKYSERGVKKVEPAVFNQVVSFLLPRMQDSAERCALVDLHEVVQTHPASR